MVKFNTVALVAVLLLVVAPGAQAGTLDVEILQNGSQSTAFGAGLDIAQTFTVGLSGDLDEFALKLGRYSYLVGDLLIDLRTTSSGVPTMPDSGANILTSLTLAHSDIPVNSQAWVTWVLSSPFSVTAGDVLAAVVRPSPAAAFGNSPTWAGDLSTTDTYLGGGRFIRGSASGWSLGGQGVDLTLRTYVNQGSTVPLPSAAWAGLGLLGLLGAVRRYRKRKTA